MCDYCICELKYWIYSIWDQTYNISREFRNRAVFLYLWNYKISTSKHVSNSPPEWYGWWQKAACYGLNLFPDDVFVRVSCLLPTLNRGSHSNCSWQQKEGLLLLFCLRSVTWLNFVASNAAFACSQWWLVFTLLLQMPFCCNVYPSSSFFSKLNQSFLF